MNDFEREYQNEPYKRPHETSAPLGTVQRLVLLSRIEKAKKTIEDMLESDGGPAWKQAQMLVRAHGILALAHLRGVSDEQND